MESFVCAYCDARHAELPMAYKVPFPVEAFPRGAVRFERDDELVRAGKDRFILANIELPVKARPGENFIWTCWISLSHASYDRMKRFWSRADRASQEPAFGYVPPLATYEPSTFALKSLVYTREIGLRPWVELEPTDHALAIEQREGISDERIVMIYHHYANLMKQTR